MLWDKMMRLVLVKDEALSIMVSVTAVAEVIPVRG
jgi:hypothetical protein